MSLSFAALASIGLGKEPRDFYFLKHQVSIFLLFFIGSLTLSFIHYKNSKLFSILLYFLILFVLLGTLLLGKQIRGTRGWLFIGSIGFQPVELVKLVLILTLAHYFSHYTRHIGKLRHIVVSGCIALVPILLVLFQPDLGSSLILISLWAGMIGMSNVSKKYIFFIIVSFSIVCIFSWFFLLKDYQKDRVVTFIHPTHDQRGGGYNVKQALIAIGSGEFFGRGLGLGSQSHLKFLPEAQTDFIFSVIAEEMGLVGVALLLSAYFLFFTRCFIIMRKARDDFGIFCIVGVVSMMVSHIVINLGGNLGLLPVTGVVLPFVSFGGSALATSLLAMGIVQSVAVHRI